MRKTTFFAPTKNQNHHKQFKQIRQSNPVEMTSLRTKKVFMLRGLVATDLTEQTRSTKKRLYLSPVSVDEPQPRPVDRCKDLQPQNGVVRQANALCQLLQQNRLNRERVQSLYPAFKAHHRFRHFPLTLTKHLQNDPKWITFWTLK